MPSPLPLPELTISGAKIVKTDWRRIRHFVVQQDGTDVTIRLDSEKRDEWEQLVDQLMEEEVTVRIKFRIFQWKIMDKSGIVNYLVTIDKE